MKKELDKGKLLTASVIVFLCAVFVVGFIWGLRSVLAMEGAYPPVVNVESLSPVPQNAEDTVSYLDSVVDKVYAEQPKIEMTQSFSLCRVCSNCGYARSENADSCPKCGQADTLTRDDSFTCNGSDALQTTLDFLTDDFLDTLSQRQMNQNRTAFANDALVLTEGDDENCALLWTDFSACAVQQNLLSRPVLSASALTDCRVDYIYYLCTACEETSDTPLDCCTLCGSTQPYVEKYRDEYDLDFTLHPDTEDAVFRHNFQTVTPDAVLALIGDKAADVCRIEQVEVSTVGAFLHAKVNRLTDKLQTLTTEEDLRITMQIRFIGQYESLGTTTLTMTLADKIEYTCTWPALMLNNKTMVIEPGQTDNLLATLICDDPTKPVVTWTSADESILTVDSEGYIKACHNPGKATVTASFEFLGQTYTDSCEVTVGIPVESMSASHRKLTLSVGASKQITAKVSPSDATVQTAHWYTEDERIATVSPDGTVTAVSVGTVTVYALSDDGYYKSSCEVTVR